MRTKYIAFLFLFAFLFIACPGSGPIIDPPDPPIPPIEYEWYNVCLDSNELQHVWCPEDRIVSRKFQKGSPDIPSTWCDFHVKPPDPPFVYPKAIEDIHAGFLGIFLWYSYTQDIEELEKTLHETRIRQVGFMDFFLFVSDGDPEHAHLNNRGPYLSLGGGQFDLSKWNTEFFTLFESFLVECKEHEITPEPNLFMDRYDYGPFENNINGVNDFWADEAYQFQVAFAVRVCQVFDKVFGVDYDEWIKPLNEGAHNGNIDKFHKLGQWHRDLWNDVFSNYTTIGHMVFDVSMSEGVQIYENEILLCGKPYHPGETHGNPQHNRNDVTRSVLAETHNVATKADLIGSEKLNFLSSKWRRYKLHGDGSNSGTGFHIPGTGFRQGTPTETYDMGFYLWTKAKEKGRQAVYSIFPMESFRDDSGNWNLWFENYKSTNIDWRRIDSLVQAHKDVYDN